MNGIKQARNPGTVENRIANYGGQTDGNDGFDGNDGIDGTDGIGGIDEM